MFIKENDVEAVYNMTASYRRLRLLSTEMALESIKLSGMLAPLKRRREFRQLSTKPGVNPSEPRPEPSEI